MPRARPLAPDRARIPLVADPHPRCDDRSAPAQDRDGDRAGGADRKDGLHPPPHRPLHAGRQRRRQHAGRRGRRRVGRLRGPRRAHLRGQGPLGERRPQAEPGLRLLVPAAQEHARLVGVRRAERLRARLRHRGRRGGPLRAAAALLGPRGAAARADPGPRRGRPRPPRGALAARSRGRRGLRRGDPGQQHHSLPPLERQLPGRARDRGRERGARGLAAARWRARADHRRRRLDGRPLPLLLELAARRPAPVRRLRSGEPEADRPALARWTARQAERRGPRR